MFRISKYFKIKTVLYLTNSSSHWKLLDLLHNCIVQNPCPFVTRRKKLRPRTASIDCSKRIASPQSRDYETHLRARRGSWFNRRRRDTRRVAPSRSIFNLQFSDKTAIVTGSGKRGLPSRIVDARGRSGHSSRWKTCRETTKPRGRARRGSLGRCRGRLVSGRCASNKWFKYNT